MCLAPISIPDGAHLVACRNCWQCRKARVDDLVGRCIAESHHASKALAVTLTYGDDAADHSSVLVYADFQKFMKRLRRKGYVVRYIVAGEYGSTFGRAHWHAILFFYGKYPEAVSLAKEREPWQVFYPRRKDDPLARIQWAPWEHGFSWIEEPSYEAFRYVLKYALKQEEKDVSVGHLAMSKKPPLGDAHFRQLAADHVKQGTVPSSYSYSFHDVRDKKGRPRKFMMQGVTRENFLSYYLRGLSARYGGSSETEWDELVLQFYAYVDARRLFTNEWLDEQLERPLPTRVYETPYVAPEPVRKRLTIKEAWDKFAKEDPEGFAAAMRERYGYGA